MKKRYTDEQIIGFLRQAAAGVMQAGSNREHYWGHWSTQVRAKPRRSWLLAEHLIAPTNARPFAGSARSQ
jgi:hypothetical protein